MEPHLLPLIRGEGPSFLPDPRVDRDPPEVVDERGASKRDDAGFVDPAALRRRGRQIRHARGVAREIRRDQIGEVAHRGKPAIERLPLERASRARLAVERLLPHRRAGVERQDLLGVIDKAGGHFRIERMPGALADEPTTRSSPPSRRWKAASTERWTIRIGSGISSPFARRSGPQPSQRSIR